MGTTKDVPYNWKCPTCEQCQGDEHNRAVSRRFTQASGVKEVNTSEQVKEINTSEYVEEVNNSAQVRGGFYNRVGQGG